MNTSMINELIEKYWEGETSLEEERVIKEYFSLGNVAEAHQKFAPLFGFFEIEKSSTLDLSLENAIKDSEVETRAAKVRILGMPRYLFSIAASIALLVCTVFIFNHLNDINTQSYVTVQGEVEELESEEALELAQEALLFLSGKLNEGSTTVRENLVVTKKGQLFK